MSEIRSLNLYIGNHNSRKGIEDLISLVEQVFGGREIPVTISSELDPYAINLIIDEFSNYFFNRKLVEFRKANPKAQIVVILTEFVNRKFGSESLNNFGGPSESGTIVVADCVARWFRNDFDGNNLASLLKLIVFMPFALFQFMFLVAKFAFGRLFGKKIGNPFQEYLKLCHRKFYMHIRYLGLKRYLCLANAVITTHENIINGYTKFTGLDGKPLRYIGVIYPEFNKDDVLSKLMVSKDPHIEITGSMTKFRYNWMKKIDLTIMSMGISGQFGRCRSHAFSEKNKKRKKVVIRGAYSLHPPQTANWRYSSPTRIYRALAVDHNFPVLTHYFGQNPIEDLCLVYDGPDSICNMTAFFRDQTRARQFLENKLDAYNQIVLVRNDALVKRVRELVFEIPSK